MRSLLLAATGIGLLGLGFTSGEPVKGDLGGPIDGLSEAEMSAYRAGRPLFLRTWIAEGEVLSNSNSCLSCHRDPTVGGVSKSIFNNVFFVPDKVDPSGFKSYPFRVTKDGVVIGQRVPEGEFHSRRPQPVYGLGLLEAISDETLLALADPDDKNKDGISGRPLMVGNKIGRFGWKANSVTTESFVDSAFHAELGIAKGTGKGGHHLTAEKVQAVADMIELMAPPQPIKMNEAGKSVFMEIGCGSCHTPKMTTGANGPWPSLNNREIEAYTDMLMHDLGPGPAKLTKGGQASPGEFRTPPLWGIGQVGGPFFHDGVTETFEDAIMRHEGEASGVLKKYKALSPQQKESVIQFLKGL